MEPEALDDRPAGVLPAMREPSHRPKRLHNQTVYNKIKGGPKISVRMASTAEYRCLYGPPHSGCASASSFRQKSPEGATP